MSTIHIRAATLDDLQAIEAIETDCFPADRRSDRRALRRSLKSPMQSVWTASCGGQTVGAMILHHYPKTLRIFSVAVLPDFRRCGAGRKMVEKALVLARADGCDTVSLEAERSNRVLTGWYEQFGFSGKHVLKDYYSPGRHAVRMKLPIKPALKGGRVRGRS
jgi:ribosomal protein S18 acetylase RimI-like enzyme